MTGADAVPLVCASKRGVGAAEVLLSEKISVVLLFMWTQPVTITGEVCDLGKFISRISWENVRLQSLLKGWGIFAIVQLSL